jgi:hypothetical protein
MPVNGGNQQIMIVMEDMMIVHLMHILVQNLVVIPLKEEIVRIL